MNLQQVRASHAFSCVQRIARQQQGDFLQLARKLPVMLQTNGLLATWAHLLAKGGKEHRNEYDDMAALLLQHLRHPSVNLAGDPNRSARDIFFEIWIAQDQGGLPLRRRTAEALELSVWLKRAAEALCDKGGEISSSPSKETLQ
jgi:CRISPR/Cas system CMR-associated protein Cmr5 small subunit